MNRSLNGNEFAEALASLGPTLSTWPTILRSPIEGFPQADKDWNTERGFVSLLCAAAWQSGALGIAEWRAKKNYGRGTRAGHVDLLLNMQGMRIGIEAKVAWLDADSDFAALNDALKSATEDASAIASPDINLRVGIAFGMYWVKPGAEREVARNLCELLDDFRKNDAGALAWNLSPAGAENDTNCYCPGGLLAAAIAD